jgi:undecaprenyl diphosphate synthase
LKLFIRNDLSALNKQNVRVRVIGSRDGLAPDLSSLLDEAQDLTADNTGLTLIIAFNYGGRQEIAEAAKQLAMRAVRGEIDPASIDPAAISASLYTAEFPDPDLIIRTSGEQRLSNFLMWQSAYAELVFLPIHWPDFDRTALETALAQYGSRERRFGGVVPRNAMTGS